MRIGICASLCLRDGGATRGACNKKSFRKGVYILLVFDKICIKGTVSYCTASLQQSYGTLLFRVSFAK